MAICTRHWCLRGFNGTAGLFRMALGIQRCPRMHIRAQHIQKMRETLCTRQRQIASGSGERMISESRARKSSKCEDLRDGLISRLTIYQRKRHWSIRNTSRRHHHESSSAAITPTPPFPSPSMRSIFKPRDGYRRPTAAMKGICSVPAEQPFSEPPLPPRRRVPGPRPRRCRRLRLERHRPCP